MYCFLIVGALLVCLTIVLIKINLDKGEAYSKAVYDNFSYDSKTIPAQRGNITDRNGTILAYSTKVYNLIIDAKIILSEKEYLEPTLKALTKYFDLQEEELRTYIKENPTKSYKRMLTKLSAEEIKEFQEAMEGNADIQGVWFEDEYQRTYPYATLAADLIGFSSDANGGEIGIESYYESYLAGTDGREYGYIDNSAYQTNITPATNGDTIISTIDYNIQNIVEQAILEFNEEYGSESTSAIVMDPNTGEILAMADYPTFDLNQPRDVSNIFTEEEWNALSEKEQVQELYQIWSNYPVSSIYEPGSVFKAITIAEAMDEQLVTPDEVFTCDGEGVYDGSIILCHGGNGHGDLTLAGALAESCNDALMQISQTIGVDTFCKYLDIFKFGTKTGIDLPSEESGLLISKEDMMSVDLATNSFGQNMNVTMTQTISAFASLINGGNYYQPHVVKEIVNEAGETVKTFDTTLVTKTISEDVSKNLREYLRTVVDYGTGGFTYMPGYSIGGKTGTAEKQPRSDKKYLVSFMGFAPAENPEILTYVVVDSPDCELFDSSWAAQVITQKIYEKLFPYLGIMADNPDYNVEVSLDPTGKETVTKPEIENETETKDVPADSTGNLTDEETTGATEESEGAETETTQVQEETTVAETTTAQ